MENRIICDDCGKLIVKPGSAPCSGGTGYARTRDGKTVCYACCAVRDRAEMIERGDSKTLPLYLSHEPFAHKRTSLGTNDREGFFSVKGEVMNWPGTLKFSARVIRGRHNIARTRYDAWFNGPDDFVWHGVQYGENTQIIHCKRTKEKVTA